MPTMSAPKKIEDLHVKIFGDGAHEEDMLAMAGNPLIKGFTTNPSLMRAAGVTDYVAFAKDVLSKIHDKPISFEVFSDDFDEMERQARIIAAWGENVYVKIPVTNTKGESSAALITKLSNDGLKLNVTAILTVEQVAIVADALAADTPAIVSVFAGRVADTGVDPLPIMRDSKAALSSRPKAELLWASCRETLNIYEADEVGADIITVPYSILNKLDEIGRDLTQHSLDGVKKFYTDGQAAGFSI
jgi:transaldolase